MLISIHSTTDDITARNSDIPWTIQKWCYENKTDNCEKFGALYTWSEAMALTSACNESDQDACAATVFGGSGWTGFRRGICPPGWHIPSDCEWQILENNLDESVETAKPDINCMSGGQSGNIALTNYDQRGTMVGNKLKLPGVFNYTKSGLVLVGGAYDDIESLGYVWTSSHYSQMSAWRRSVAGASSDRHEMNKGKTGISVRCLKD